MMGAAPQQFLLSGPEIQAGFEKSNGISTSSAHVRLGDSDFLYAAPTTIACAAFSEESRMKFANAIKLRRKSGGTWGTRPVLK